MCAILKFPPFCIPAGIVYLKGFVMYMKNMGFCAPVKLPDPCLHGIHSQRFSQKHPHLPHHPHHPRSRDVAKVARQLTQMCSLGHIRGGFIWNRIRRQGRILIPFRWQAEQPCQLRRWRLFLPPWNFLERTFTFLHEWDRV